VIYETDTNRVLVYDNAAWIDPSTGKTERSGLAFIKSDSITSGNSKEITDVFSSNYANYQIVLSELKLSGAANVLMRMGTTSTGVYYWAGIQRTYGGVTNAEQGSAASSWIVGIVGTTGNASSGIIHLVSPQIAQPTTFNCLGQDTRTDGSGARAYSGFINNTTQYTSFTLIGDSSTTFSSCNIRVYGYN
jgi:hypothetical protein